MRRTLLQPAMQVWAVTDPTALSDELFERALRLVDDASRTKIRRFYRRADACRCLIGRLLPRVLAAERGAHPASIAFGATPAGKPYFTSPADPALAFNVSHDNDVVALVHAPGAAPDAPAYRVGVDVMKLQLPLREPFRSFVHTVGDTLTDDEKTQLLAPDVSPDEALRRFYTMWTAKEAYTKALGRGLGFDFRRVAVDVPARAVRVDGAPPAGWEFALFGVAAGGGAYQGVVARFVGGAEAVVRDAEAGEVRMFDAGVFVQDAVRILEVQSVDEHVD